MWTWSAVVLPIFTIASVIAAVISRFCWSVRPAYHWIVMFGMASLLKALGSLRYVAGLIAARRPPGKVAAAGTLVLRAGLTARPNEERGRDRPAGWAHDQTEPLANAECGSGRRRPGDAGASGPDPSPPGCRRGRGAARRRRDRRR